jgi:hypothetical protein
MIKTMETSQNVVEVLLLPVTGEGPSDAERCPSERGFDHHLVKPIDPDRLIGLLSDMAEVLHQPSP